MTALTGPVPPPLSAAPVQPQVGEPPAGFAAALARHAMDWHQNTMTEAQVLDAVTRSVVALIRSARGAALLVLDHPGELTIRATHGTLPELNLSPVMAPDSLSPGPAWVNTLQDLPTPTRWPVFTAPAGPAGAGIICTPLGSGHIMFGTLIVATTSRGKTLIATAAVTEMLTVLAMHASNALAAAHDRDNLYAAVAHRDVIGQAKGILMERHRITADAAFTKLVHLSQNSNTKLRDLCSHLADTGEIPRPVTKNGSAHTAASPEERKVRYDQSRITRADHRRPTPGQRS